MGIVKTQIVRDNPQPSFLTMGMIYMIHLPSGKKYIGQHKDNNLADRKNTHKHQFNYFCKKKKSNLNTANPTGFCTALYNAFNKYGINNCVWTVVEYNVVLDKINDVEDNYIKEYNTLHPNGYNLRLNNSEYKVFSQDTIKKMSNSQSNVFKNKLHKYRRYPDELKDMPKHVNFIRRGNIRGYRVANHPKSLIKNKSFTSSTLSIETLKNQTIKYLEKIENKSISEILRNEQELKVSMDLKENECKLIKVSRELPKCIEHYKNGYKAIFIKNKKSHSKSFIDPSNSKEENLRLAVQWYELFSKTEFKNERTLPEGVSYYKNGFRARVRHKNKVYAEYFRDDKLSKEKKIELAVQWLIAKKAEIKKLKEEGPETRQ
jgi:hypothetical protein